jgi:DegV family protein with EDD domain
MIRVVTDSNADLSSAQAQTLGVDAIVSTYVNFGDKTYRSVDLPIDEFYALLKSSPDFPKTSQPSVGDFVQAYERFKGDEVVSLHISRDLSGTINSAESAAAMMNGDPAITLIDTRSVNAGQTLLVAEAVRLAQEGAKPAEIKAHIESLIPRVRMHFAFDTLENLKRGGRVGNAQAFLGSVLQMKPIITIKDGKLEPLERVRTMSKAIARLKEIVIQDVAGKPPPKVVVMHAHAADTAQQIADDLCAQLKIDRPMIIEAGPAVATHSGPGAVGVAYLV